MLHVPPSNGTFAPFIPTCIDTVNCDHTCTLDCMPHGTIVICATLSLASRHGSPAAPNALPFVA